jgi:hypothetical protein
VLFSNTYINGSLSCYHLCSSRSKVVLTTTLGAIDIELWGKEAPRAVRNFIQLCLEDYYENTIFHRIIKVQQCMLRKTSTRVALSNLTIRLNHSFVFNRDS